jgi:flavin-dependent dehydrogenase
MQQEGINSIIVDNIKINSDLYVDCTGFNKVLTRAINNTHSDGYEGNVNAALFARIPYGHPKTDRIPYTKADAWGNGWCWTIPLTSRIGSGCVYNSNFCSEEEAKEHFVNYWEGAVSKDNVKAISFSSESLISPWKSNVVAVGLSAGFIEPLEATGISWFVLSSQMLGIMLRNRFYDESLMHAYNGTMRAFIEDVQDFIDTHYMLSNRSDSEFWKYQTTRDRHPRLLKRLDMYKKYMPNNNNRRYNIPWAFNDVSWIDILTGYHFKFDNQNVPIELMDEKEKELVI